MYSLYRELLRLRRESPALRFPDRDRMRVTPVPDQRVLLVERWDADAATLVAMNFSPRPATVPVPGTLGPVVKRLDTADPRWLGPGSGAPGRLRPGAGTSLTLAPTSLAVYVPEPGTGP